MFDSKFFHDFNGALTRLKSIALILKSQSFPPGISQEDALKDAITTLDKLKQDLVARQGSNSASAQS